MIDTEFCNDSRCERIRKGEMHAAHDLSKLDENRVQSLDRLIQCGSLLIGGSIGAAAGFLITGITGAVAGSMVGTVIGTALKNVGEDVATRLLGDREKIRVGAAFIYAVNKIQENFTNGKELRHDDFFNDGANRRSKADEIVEGVLIAGQRDHEERKLMYYGNLLGNIAFSDGISRAHANLLIKLVQNLSYRQLCLLALFAQVDKFNLQQESYRSTPTMSVSKLALLQEVLELDSQGLITSGSVVFGHADIIPGKMHLEGQGEILYKLMQLSRIDQKELYELAQVLT